MTVTLKPLGNRILLRIRPFPEKVGLIYTPSRREYSATADVLDVGPEVRDVKAGDVIIVPVLVGQEVGEDRLVPEDSVLGFLEEE